MRCCASARIAASSALKGATGAGDVVTHCAVDAEQLSSACDVAFTVEDLGVREVGTGSDGLHVVGHREDLLVGELHRLLGGLGTLHLQRHPAGTDLEVDGDGADTVERRAVLGSLQGKAVAGGAVGLEQLLAVLDREARGCCSVRLGGCHRGGGASVDAARDEQSDADE